MSNLSFDDLRKYLMFLEDTGCSIKSFNGTSLADLNTFELNIKFQRNVEDNKSENMEDVFNPNIDTDKYHRFRTTARIIKYSSNPYLYKTVKMPPDMFGQIKEFNYASVLKVGCFDAKSYCYFDKSNRMVYIWDDNYHISPIDIYVSFSNIQDEYFANDIRNFTVRVGKDIFGVLNEKEGRYLYVYRLGGANGTLDLTPSDISIIDRSKTNYPVDNIEVCTKYGSIYIFSNDMLFAGTELHISTILYPNYKKKRKEN